MARKKTAAAAPAASPAPAEAGARSKLTQATAFVGALTGLLIAVGSLTDVGKGLIANVFGGEETAANQQASDNQIAAVSPVATPPQPETPAGTGTSVRVETAGPSVVTFETRNGETLVRIRPQQQQQQQQQQQMPAIPTPPPPPAPPCPSEPCPPPPSPPPPPPAVVGPYFVFFDWGDDAITPQSAMILDNAAAALQASGPASLVLAGHADRSGGPDYNVGLSQRRADNVRAYLAARGVPDAAMTTEALGESRPLLDTADGVREPQNRRVEITFGPGLSQ